MTGLREPLITVVAGVIRREGKFLICRRSTNSKHALQWEFAGGKVEAGESPAEALVRELHEELGLQVRVGRELDSYQFAYPGKRPIQLIFIEVTAFEGEPVNRQFEEITWESLARLSEYDFLEGDVEFLRRLRDGTYAP